MQIDASGWLAQARQVISPNYNLRPGDAEVSLIVVHNISLPPGRFGGQDVEALFTNSLDCSKDERYQALQELKVSSHFFIRRCGMVVQFVPVHLRAWHAGRSSYLGRENCNDFSIGIELEGTDDRPYELEQYRVLTELCRVLIDYFPELSSEHITGHEHIAPGRKTDPGASFDWHYFKRLLAKKYQLVQDEVKAKG